MDDGRRGRENQTPDLYTAAPVDSRYGMATAVLAKMRGALCGVPRYKPLARMVCASRDGGLVSPFQGHGDSIVQVVIFGFET